MKLLVIGDFHGTFPKKFEQVIKKEKIDAVISNGDFFPFIYRDLWFKHCYRTKKELWEVIGKKKTKGLVLKDLREGEKAFKALNHLPVPVFTTVGNVDHLGEAYNDQSEGTLFKKSGWKWYDQDFFSPLAKKYSHITRIDYTFAIVGEYVLIGAYGGSSPGLVKSVAYRRHKKKLDRLFTRFRGKKIIFVSHNVPYNTKLDKIGMKAHIKVRGKHYGSKLIRRTIDKWQPLMHIGGHIHEGRGMQKLGRTLCVNPGSAHENQAAIITLQSGKVKVTFIK